jgi:hypothetical protein
MTPQWSDERQWVRDALEQQKDALERLDGRLWYIILSLLFMVLGTIVNTVLNFVSLQQH